MTRSFYQYLCNHFLLPQGDPREPTHLYYPSRQNNGRAGRFFIPTEKLEEVYQRYMKCVCTTTEKAFLIERSYAPYPFVADLDLKDGDPETPTLYEIASTHHDVFWKRIRTVFVDVFADIFDTTVPPEIHFLRRADSQCYHIHIPSTEKIFMDGKRMHLFRDVALERMRADPEIAELSSSPIPDKEWEKFYDRSIYKSPKGKSEYVTLRLVGSYSTKNKEPASGPYMPPDGSITMESLSKYSLVLYQGVFPEDVRQLVPLREEFEEHLVAAAAKKTSLKKACVLYADRCETQGSAHDGNVGEVRAVLWALPERYSIEHDLWWNTGIALANDGVPKELFVEWSQRTPASAAKYTDGCEDHVYRARRVSSEDRQRTVASIYYDLKQEDADVFHEFQQRRFQFPTEGEEYDVGVVEEMASKVQKIDDVEAFKDALARYVSQFLAMITIGPNLYVIREKRVDGETLHDLWKVSTAADYFINKLVSCGAEEKKEDIKPFVVWKSHPDIPYYIGGLAFDPPGFAREPHTYNIYTGLKITREMCQHEDADAVEPLLDHIRHVWCGNDERNYNDVVNFLAHIIQKVGVKMGVALVLQSMEGAGKGVVIEKMAEIIGEKYLCHPTNADQVLGTFNGALEGKLLAFFDEMTFGGDKRTAGCLKKLITEKRVTINKKHISSYTVPNHLNVIFASNEEWVVPAAEACRRYLVLKLDNTYAGISNGDKMAYFDAILMVPAAAFAKFLYERDLSEFNPRNIQITEGLREQQMQTFSPVKKWYHNLLSNGVLELEEKERDEYGHSVATSREFEFGELWPKSAVFEHFKRASHSRFADNEQHFWRQVREVCPDLTQNSKKNPMRARYNNARPTAVRFPPLERAQELFRKAIKDPQWTFGYS